MTRLLIVEDEKDQREDLRELMLGKGWDVEVACSVPEAELLLAAGPFDVVLADVRIEGGADGTELLGRCGEARVVMMSAYGCVDSAVDAMKRGAADYVTKPINHEDLYARLARAAPPRASATVVEEMLLGESAPMRAVRDRVRRMAATDLGVLFAGEFGTGKQLAARALHLQSARRRGPFVAFRCGETDESLVTTCALLGHEAGAVPGSTEARAGLFESADGGTVFLDEVGNLSFFAQERLLGVLRNREVHRIGSARPRRIDVRVVAATKVDLEDLVRQQRFSDALYYHLKEVMIRLPPLCERGEDILLLARRAIANECAKRSRPPVSLSERACQTLLSYAWPGNVRQLESYSSSALALCDGDEIATEHLPEEVGARPLPAEGSIDDHIRRTVLRYQGELTERQIAVKLGIHEETLRRWRRDHDLPRPPQKPPPSPPQKPRRK